MNIYSKWCITVYTIVSKIAVLQSGFKTPSHRVQNEQFKITFSNSQ